MPSTLHAGRLQHEISEAAGHKNTQATRGCSWVADRFLKFRRKTGPCTPSVHRGPRHVQLQSTAWSSYGVLRPDHHLCRPCA
eukprot:3687994-Prymnesium_polylepis.1